MSSLIGGLIEQLGKSSKEAGERVPAKVPATITFIYGAELTGPKYTFGILPEFDTEGNMVDAWLDFQPNDSHGPFEIMTEDSLFMRASAEFLEMNKELFVSPNVKGIFHYSNNWLSHKQENKEDVPHKYKDKFFPEEGLVENIIKWTVVNATPEIDDLEVALGIFAQKVISGRQLSKY